MATLVEAARIQADGWWRLRSCLSKQRYANRERAEEARYCYELQYGGVMRTYLCRLDWSDPHWHLSTSSLRQRAEKAHTRRD